MNANGHGTLNLREREQLLVETYPWIPWTEPQRVITATTTRLACRFCTAIEGLTERDVSSGAVGFSSAREFSEHLEGEHAR